MRDRYFATRDWSILLSADHLELKFMAGEEHWEQLLSKLTTRLRQWRLCRVDEISLEVTMVEDVTPITQLGW